MATALVRAVPGKTTTLSVGVPRLYVCIYALMRGYFDGGRIL